MTLASQSSPVGGESQLSDPWIQRSVIGVLAIALSAASITLVAASAPWQIRFVALQMLVGLALVIWHIWALVATSLGLLAVSLAAGLKLLSDNRKQER